MAKSPLISFPGNATPPIPRIPQSLVPISAIPFTPPFDVIHELSTRRPRYLATDRENKISLDFYPPLMRISIDTIRARVRDSAPGAGISLVCCATNGLDMLSRDPAFRDMIRYRKKLDLLTGDNPTTPDVIVETVTSWFDEFNIQLPEGPRHKFSVLLPLQLKIDLNLIAQALARKFPQYQLFYFSVMMTLVTQPNILDEHRKIMRSCIDRVFKLMQFRQHVAKSMLLFIDPKLVIDDEPDDIEEEFDHDDEY